VGGKRPKIISACKSHWEEVTVRKKKRGRKVSSPGEKGKKNQAATARQGLINSGGAQRGRRLREFNGDAQLERETCSKKKVGGVPTTVGEQLFTQEGGKEISRWLGPGSLTKKESFSSIGRCVSAPKAPTVLEYRKIRGSPGEEGGGSDQRVSG